jgi:wobble nucleotide-excising tRNase
VIVTVIERHANDSERVVTDVVRQLVEELHTFAPPAVRLDSALERESWPV